ncbi:MAG: GGDEF domain-containing protein [Clostridia bacterium]|nr:GGDEF domain-containing protein [Clostridia bacterium]
MKEKVIQILSWGFALHTTSVSAKTAQGGKMGWITAAVILAVLFLTLLTAFILRDAKMKKQLLKSRMIDSETGIGNLVHFEHYFERNISDFSRRLYYVAYFVINSNYLHIYHEDKSFSDVAKHTAKVLMSNEEPYEITARISESGFAFAFMCPDDETATGRVHRLLDELNKCIEVKNDNNEAVFYTAIYHLEPNDRDCKMILFNLRRNCNKIFGSSREFVLCDSHSMNSIQEKKEYAERIKNGFENDEFKLYVQFIVNNKEKKIVSAEALSRWENPDDGIVPPGKYIGVMSRSGLISTFDYYMFEKVCKQLEEWKDTILGEVTLSCNFTRITISEEDFVKKIKNISEKYSFDASKLYIEITEDAMEKNVERAMNNISECKKMGFRIALDDLGSGYTSLTNLCEYPIDVVKLDRDILLRTQKQNGKDLFCGLIALAHSLNLKVVCEGVETKEQEQLVSDTSCDYIQGWHYSKVIPVSECEEFVSSYARSRGYNFA